MFGTNSDILEIPEKRLMRPPRRVLSFIPPTLRAVKNWSPSECIPML
jgi:hypothetical protein